MVSAPLEQSQSCLLSALAIREMARRPCFTREEQTMILQRSEEQEHIIKKEMAGPAMNGKLRQCVSYSGQEEI